MANLCIIPARGGSKRIYRKNIKDFLGKPIIAYSIEVALASGLFSEVMVSTDDNEIAEISQKYGAKVPFMRSKENADDFATTMDVISEVLSNYKKKLGREFQYICCIYPTAPLIQAKHLIEGLAKLKTNLFTSVFPMVAFSYPVWRGLEMVDNEKVKMIWPEFLNTRSQDLKKVYHDAGQWYWFNYATIENWTWPAHTGAIVLLEDEVQDIDNDIDWKMAEMKYTLLNKASV